MSDIARLDAELNDMIRAGQALDAFEKFYSEDCVMMENDEACVGKDANRKREHEFFAAVEEVHEFTIGATAVGDGVSFCEQHFEATFKGGKRVRMEQVALRWWNDGKVVKERFFYKGSH